LLCPAYSHQYFILVSISNNFIGVDTRKVTEQSQTPQNNSDKSSNSNLKRKIVIVIKDAYAEPALVAQKT